MNTLSNLVSLISIVGIVVGASYTFLPGTYAAVAYTTGALPVTAALEEKVPGQVIGFRLRKMGIVADEMTASRKRLFSSRRLIKEKISDYRISMSESSNLLKEAREAYRNNPNANEYYFIGRAYSPEMFGMQIESIHQQVLAQKNSLKLLGEAQNEVQIKLTELSVKESQLAVNRHALENVSRNWMAKNVAGQDHAFDLSRYVVNRIDSVEFRNR